MGYSFRLTAMHHPTDRIAHTTAFVTPVVVQRLEREIAQWVHFMKDRSDDPSHPPPLKLHSVSGVANKFGIYSFCDTVKLMIICLLVGFFFIYYY